MLVSQVALGSLHSEGRDCASHDINDEVVSSLKRASSVLIQVQCQHPFFFHCRVVL